MKSEESKWKLGNDDTVEINVAIPSAAVALVQLIIEKHEIKTST